jgi:hypothetical protein
MTIGRLSRSARMLREAIRDGSVSRAEYASAVSILRRMARRMDCQAIIESELGQVPEGKAK